MHLKSTSRSYIDGQVNDDWSRILQCIPRIDLIGNTWSASALICFLLSLFFSFLSFSFFFFFSFVGNMSGCTKGRKNKRKIAHAIWNSIQQQHVILNSHHVPWKFNIVLASVLTNFHHWSNSLKPGGFAELHQETNLL